MKQQDKMNKQRRQVLAAAGITTAAIWHKPIINSVVLPAHAQASVCPAIVVGNVLTGPVSGTNVPAVCSVTFDVLSGDEFVTLDITAVDTGTLPSDVTVTVDSLGTASFNMGPRVTWRGPATEAPFCSDVTPGDNVTFTITATCAAAPGGGTFSQDFTLTDIIALEN